ncbi:transposase [Streptomyces cinerochromogenes]|uniref:transposase n=1 Tax=Streptomyces cinerochromogenes TaxID=66422 RepID=UPI0033B9941B
MAELPGRLREAVCRAEGRSPEPSAAVVGSQSVEAEATVTHVSRGFDAGKKTNGRKRHLLTDTLGLLLAALVTPVSTTDRDAARVLLPATKKHFRGWRRSGRTAVTPATSPTWTVQHLRVVLDIVRRSDDVQGFQVLPRRWVVERSFVRLLRSRRLVGDYERRADTSESVILWSMTMLMSRRLAVQRRQSPAPARTA